MTPKANTSPNQPSLPNHCTPPPPPNTLLWRDWLITPDECSEWSIYNWTTWHFSCLQFLKYIRTGNHFLRIFIIHVKNYSNFTGSVTDDPATALARWPSHWNQWDSLRDYSNTISSAKIARLRRVVYGVMLRVIWCKVNKHHSKTISATHGTSRDGLSYATNVC